MLVEVNLRPLSVYLIYLDSLFVFLCAQLIYCQDLDQSVIYGRNEKLAVLNAQVYYYSNSMIVYAPVVYFVYPIRRFITIFTTGLLLLLAVRVSSSGNLSFVLNIPNMLGASLGLFYLVTSWYKFNVKRTFELPVDERYFEKTKSKKKSKSRKKEVEEEDEDEEDEEEDEEDEMDSA